MSTKKTDYSTLIGGGLSLLGGLLGNKKPANPYKDQILSNARNMAMTRQTYSGFTNDAQNSYRQFNPQYKSSVNDYGDYLRTDPYTDTYSTRQLSRATAATNSNYSAAKSRLAAEMARRGIYGGGSEAGTLGSIEAARAGQISTAQNDLALRAADARNDRLAALANLYGTARNEERSAMLNGLAGQSNQEEQLAQIYDSLNKQANEASASNPLATCWEEQGVCCSKGRGAKATRRNPNATCRIPHSSDRSSQFLV